LINNTKKDNSDDTVISSDVREALGKFIFTHYTTGKGKALTDKITANFVAKNQKLGTRTEGFKINKENFLQTLMTGGAWGIFGKVIGAMTPSKIKITISKDILAKFHKQHAVQFDKNYLRTVDKFLVDIRQYTQCVTAINFYSEHDRRVRRVKLGTQFRLSPYTHMDQIEANLGYKAQSEVGIVGLEGEPAHELAARERQHEKEAKEKQWIESTKREALTRLNELVHQIEFISYIFKQH